MTTFEGFFNRYDAPIWSDWGKEFVIMTRINGKWIFCRKVYRRRHLYGTINGKPIYDYALNDFELLQKSENK